jgi:hypothetical protein
MCTNVGDTRTDTGTGTWAVLMDFLVDSGTLPVNCTSRHLVLETFLLQYADNNASRKLIRWLRIVLQGGDGRLAPLDQQINLTLTNPN